MGDSDDLLYQTLIKAMNMDQEKQINDSQPDGVHFIDSGEALVVGKGYSPNCRLSKCDAFGMCEILRKTVSPTTISTSLSNLPPEQSVSS